MPLIAGAHASVTFQTLFTCTAQSHALYSEESNISKASRCSLDYLKLLIDALHWQWLVDDCI